MIWKDEKGGHVLTAGKWTAGCEEGYLGCDPADCNVYGEEKDEVSLFVLECEAGVHAQHAGF